MSLAASFFASPQPLSKGEGLLAWENAILHQVLSFGEDLVEAAMPGCPLK